ncbi:hypothetical protein, partial [Tritonibacter sp. SIMBA_163]|uniref:hypothetical protein n=1 Tax=Tritonibacter sp. SIMBA_163 TaxID=3080868 RepID=UPI003980A30A
KSMTSILLNTHNIGRTMTCSSIPLPMKWDARVQETRQAVPQGSRSFENSHQKRKEGPVVSPITLKFLLPLGSAYSAASAA